MPEEDDDDDHANIPTTTAVAIATTPVSVAPTSPAMAKPTDHPDRPNLPKPSGAQQDVASPTGTSAAVSATATPSSWLPSFLPTLGVGPKTQIWIYGAAGLIIVFCCGLGVYFFLARRKRLRNNPRDEWEFDLLEEDEADGLNGGGRGKGRRRAGELYDAFAAGSEDESDEEFDEGGDEREKMLYDDDEDSPGEGSSEGGKHVIGEDDDDESLVEAENEKRRPSNN